MYVNLCLQPVNHIDILTAYNKNIFLCFLKAELNYFDIIAEELVNCLKDMKAPDMAFRRRIWQHRI